MSYGFDKLAEYREVLLRLVASHGASNARLFGSFARGEATDSSDVDLLVDFESGRSLLDLIGLEQDLSDLLGRPVQVVTRSSLSPRIRDRVLEEAKAL